MIHWKKASDCSKKRTRLLNWAAVKTRSKRSTRREAMTARERINQLLDAEHIC